MNIESKFVVGDLVMKKDTKSPLKIERFTDNGEVRFENGPGAYIKDLNDEYSLFTPVYDPEAPIKIKMVDEGIRLKLESSAEYYVTVEGIDIPIVGGWDNSFEELLEELCSCDGYMSRFIFDYCSDDLENALLAAGLIFKNVRGSYGATEKLRKLYDAIIQESYKMKELEPNMEWTPTEENIAKLPAPIREYIEGLSDASGRASLKD